MMLEVWYMYQGCASSSKQSICLFIHILITKHNSIIVGDNAVSYVQYKQKNNGTEMPYGSSPQIS